MNLIDGNITIFDYLSVINSFSLEPYIYIFNLITVDTVKHVINI